MSQIKINLKNESPSQAQYHRSLKLGSMLKYFNWKLQGSLQKKTFKRTYMSNISFADKTDVSQAKFILLKKQHYVRKICYLFDQLTFTLNIYIYIYIKIYVTVCIFSDEPRRCNKKSRKRLRWRVLQYYLPAKSC